MQATGIEWTDRTWNPVRGCSRVSPGCLRCYAERDAARFSDPGAWGHGYAERTPAGPRWTGLVALHAEKLIEPLRLNLTQRIFVNSTSDLFHEALPDLVLDRVFSVIASAHWHRFQVLTKRHERMRFYLRGLTIDRLLDAAPDRRFARYVLSEVELPLPNLWIGVSVEDQEWANERIPLLLDTPAAVRFVSAEPLLGPIDLTRIGLGAIDPDFRGIEIDALTDARLSNTPSNLNWVIAGGETGRGARPMDPDWARSLRDQCLAARVPFFFKQWGATLPMAKKRAGRELDGREWNQFPGVTR